MKVLIVLLLYKFSGSSILLPQLQKCTKYETCANVETINWCKCKKYETFANLQTMKLVQMHKI